MKLETQDRNSAEGIGICVLLGILVAIVFGQTLGHAFVHYDDFFYVADNPHVTGGLTLPAVAGAFASKEGGLWTPLVTISHMLDWQLYGSHAGGHHLTNVLLHLGSAILLFLILRRMTGAQWRSAFVAAVFAIHPLHVESVAWIAERKDVLSGLFFMLTLGAYLRYVERPDSRGRYAGVILMFALGLMSKPMLVTLPVVLLLLDYWPLKRLFQLAPAGSDPGKGVSISRRVVVEKIPLLVLSAAACAVTVLGAPNTAAADFVQVPFRLRMAEAPASFVIYLGQMVWPARLAVIYTHFEDSLPWWPAALALLAFVSLGIFLVRGRHPYLWMGWLWNLIMLAPASGVVQISRHLRADHYNYLPQIGLSIGLTWAVADWAGERRQFRAMLGGAAGVILLALAIAARRQTACWRDDMTLWTHTLECTRDNAAAHDQLGDALVSQGRTKEALSEYREALRIYPAYTAAHNNLGLALCRLGQATAGIAEFREALKINPAFVDALCNLGNTLIGQGRIAEGMAEFREAVRVSPSSAKAHYGLGDALVRQGQTGEGVAELSEAVRINPDYADALTALGMALVGQGEAEEGIARLREALRVNPIFPLAHDDLGIALFEQGQAEEGVSEFREAVRLDPGFAEAHFNLGSALLRQGRTGEGIDELRAAVRIDPGYERAHYSLGKALLGKGLPEEGIAELRAALQVAPANARVLDNPNILRTLAAAYAAAGRYPEAVQTAQSALDIAKTGDLAEALRREIKLYEAGQPLPGGP